MALCPPENGLVGFLQDMIEGEVAEKQSDWNVRVEYLQKETEKVPKS